MNGIGEIGRANLLAAGVSLEHARTIARQTIGTLTAEEHGAVSQGEFPDSLRQLAVNHDCEPGAFYAELCIEINRS